LFEKLLDLFGRDTDCNSIKNYQADSKPQRLTTEYKPLSLTDEYESIAEISAKLSHSREATPSEFDTPEVIVVGVSFYQKALEKICGGRREEGIELHVQAEIIPYDDNSDDAHAVKIEIEGEIVGHLSRKKALIWRSKMISEGFSGAVTCPAKIAWDRNFDKAGSYGVWLDIDLTLPNSLPERNSAHAISAPPNQSNPIEFLVNQLNRFELLNCKAGDEVNLWQKGDSREIYIYRKNTPFGKGQIGICPDSVYDDLLAAAGWDASIASIYDGGCKIVCKLLSKAEMGKEEDQDEALDNAQTDYIEPSKEEVSREMEKWMFVFKKKLDALQKPDKWFHEETQEEKRRRKSSEFSRRWMKPFVRPADFEREEVRALAVNGLYWSQIIMKELRKVIRQARKEGAIYDGTLHSLYGLAIVSSLRDDFCNSLPSGYNNSVCEYVAYSEIEGIGIDYMKIGYSNLNALGKTDIKWLIERFGEPNQHMTTKDIYSEIISNAIIRYIWNKHEDGNRKFGKYGVLTIEQCLEGEIKSGFYSRFLIAGQATRSFLDRGQSREE